MHKAIQTMVAFFAGIFGIKQKAPETPVNRRLPARIAVYSAPMNRAQRRAYAARVAIVERTIAAYLDHGYDEAINEARRKIGAILIDQVGRLAK